MTDRLLPYIAGAMGVLFLSAGCEQANIYSEVDFNVTLDPSNTYVAGEPVRFNISGNPDNLLFYSGEIGHAYQYRDRYEVPVEQVTSIVLDMNIEHRYGEKDHSALEIYYTNEFPGLNGNDAQADVALVKGMYEGGMSGWTKVDFEDPGPKADVTFQVQTGNMKDCVDNLCIAFHCLLILEFRRHAATAVPFIPDLPKLYFPFKSGGHLRGIRRKTGPG